MNPTSTTPAAPDSAPIEYRRDDTLEQAQEKGRREGAGGLPDVPPSTYRPAAMKKAWRLGWAIGEAMLADATLDRAAATRRVADAERRITADETWTIDLRRPAP